MKRKSSQDNLVKIDAGLNTIIVGSVPIEKIHFRRDNPRRMNATDMETLRASMDMVGLQGFLRVELKENGEYDLVDGHHRLEEIKGRGGTVAPVIVLPEGLNKTDLDLLMLSLNVSGRVDTGPFAKLINEVLADGIDPELVRKHASISSEFMSSLLEMTKDVAVPDLEAEELPKDLMKESKKPKTPKVKIVEVRTNGELKRIMVPLDMVFDRETRSAMEEASVEIVSEEAPKWCSTVEEFIGEVL